MLQNAVTDLVALDKKQIEAGDVNGDGQISVKDIQDLRETLQLKVADNVSGETQLAKDETAVLLKEISMKLHISGQSWDDIVRNQDKVIRVNDVLLLLRLLEGIIQANGIRPPKRNKVTIRLEAFEKGENLTWFVATQAAYKMAITLRDDKQTYFSVEKPEGNMKPVTGEYKEYKGKNLVLEISIPASDDIKAMPSVTDLIDKGGKVVGHNLICYGEDWVDNDYDDFYINVVGWKVRK